MADIHEVITRFVYSSDTKELDKAYAVLANNIKAIDDNRKSIERLEAVRAATDKSNLERQAQLDRAITNRKKSITDQVNLIKAEVAANDNLRKSINQNIKVLNDLTKTETTYVNAQGKLIDRQERLAGASNKTAIALINVSRVLQDLPYGILGVANNIDPLITSLGGSAGLSIAVSAVTSLLVVFGDELFNSGEDAEKAAEKTKDYAQEVESLNEQLVENIRLTSERSRLLDEASNKGVNQAKRDLDQARARGASLEEIAALERELIFRQIKDLTLLQGAYLRLRNQVKDLGLTPDTAGDTGQIQNILFNILIGSDFRLSMDEAQAQSERLAQSFKMRGDLVEVIKTEEAAITEKVKDLESDLRVNDFELNKEVEERNKKSFEDAYKNELERIDNELELKKLNDTFLQKLESRIATAIETNNALKELRREEGKPFSAEEQEAMDKTVQNDIRVYQKLAKLYEERLKIGALQEKIDVASRYGKGADRAKFLGQANDADAALLANPMDREYFNPTFLDSLNARSLSRSMQASRQVISKENEKQFKDAEERRKKNNESILKSEKALQDAILQIMADTAQRQIQLLDYEISVRQQRVQQATLLAQEGNAEILKSEQERLDAAQKKREEIAQRQLQINQLLQASSAAIAAAQALQTVTNAGATGDPYSAAARIAAAVAALAAGFAFVSNLVNTFRTDGFKEGVINYKGKGTGTSDSNLVRISHGESVMTAQETKEYMPALQAMRDGSFYTKYLPNQYTYVTKKTSSHNRGVESRLDTLISQKQDIKVKTLVSNGQLATLVEREKRLNKRRFGR